MHHRVRPLNSSPHALHAHDHRRTGEDRMRMPRSGALGGGVNGSVPGGGSVGAITRTSVSSVSSMAPPSPRAGGPSTGAHLRHGRPHRIRGWALVRWAGARLAQRRYLKLVHYSLTVFDGSNEDVDLVLLEQVLVGTTVTINPKRYEIVVRSERDKLVVQVKTAKEFDAWKTGFADAARSAEQYYTLVHSRKLGAGAFSEVFFGFDRDTGDHAAIKVVDKRQCTRAMVEHSETEARIMAVVHHSAIIACHDIFDAPQSLHVVMEFMPGGTLEDKVQSLISTQGHVPEAVAATVIERVLCALVYLDNEGICHRDIKPDNILIGATKNGTNSTDSWETTIRVSDFGLATFVTPSKGLLTDFVGTPEYVAPEVLARCADNSRVGYGCSVDVWAAGVISFWMLSGGELPFDGEDCAAICRAIKEGKLKMHGGAWDNVSAHGKSFVRSLLQPRPRTRLSAAAALSHPWILRSKGEKRTATYASMASVFAMSRAKKRGFGRSRESVFQRRKLSPKALLRTSVTAVTAANRLCQAVLNMPLRPGRESLASTLSSPNVSIDSATGSSAGVKPRRVGDFSSAGSLKRPLSRRAQAHAMQAAPERPPAGTDALGYNVGIFRSFAPKQRQRAGVVENGNPEMIRSTTAPISEPESPPSLKDIRHRARSLGGHRSRRRARGKEDPPR